MFLPFADSTLQKGKSGMSGSQFQKTKEDVAAIMREKQKKGALHTPCAAFKDIED